MKFVENDVIQRLTQELEKAKELQAQYTSIITKLKEENDFLTETITTNKLGKIASERRELKAKVRDLRFENQQAHAIKAEYEEKLTAINCRSKSLDSLQIQIEAHIETEARKILTKYQEELDRAYKKKEEKNNSVLQERLCRFQKQRCILLAITIASVLIGTLSFYVNLA